MKKLFVICVLGFFLSSCERVETKESMVKDYQRDEEINLRVTKIEYDSCEYIISSWNLNGYSQSGIVHKGNCKYCLQRAKK